MEFHETIEKRDLFAQVAHNIIEFSNFPKSLYFSDIKNCFLYFQTDKNLRRIRIEKLPSDTEIYNKK